MVLVGCCAPPARWRWPFRWTGLLIIIIAAAAVVRRHMLRYGGRHHLLTTPVFNIAKVLDDQGVPAPSCAPCLVINASPAGLQLPTWALLPS